MDVSSRDTRPGECHSRRYAIDVFRTHSTKLEHILYFVNLSRCRRRHPDARLSGVKTEPQQQRSVASTEKMLDAAEALLAEGGPEALTIGAVVDRSGVSNGSLYARFGDRRGLLVAVQDRFLDRLQYTTTEQIILIANEPELASALRLLAGMFHDTFTGNRGAFNAFMFQTLPDTEFRKRGQQATRLAFAAVADVINARSDQVEHPNPARAADFVFRTFFALGTQLAMFDDNEPTGTGIGRDGWINEATHMTLGYLTGGTAR